MLTPPRKIVCKNGSAGKFSGVERETDKIKEEKKKLNGKRLPCKRFAFFLSYFQKSTATLHKFLAHTASPGTSYTTVAVPPNNKPLTVIVQKKKKLI